MAPSQGIPSTSPALQIAGRWYWVPVYLGLICLLSYGLLIPLLGFYWDDWPITWYPRVLGPGEIRYLESYRPLSGWWLALLRPLLAEAPVRWQLFDLAIRWLLGWATWSTLRRLWPNRSDLALWAAALLVVYPGFGTQFVSVNTSRHLLGLTLFVVSVGLMLKARHSSSHRTALTLLSILLMIVSHLTTDYFYGLEILRPIFLLAVSWREAGTARQRMASAFKAWVPYLTIAGLIAVWRFAWLERVFYPISFLSENRPEDASLSVIGIGQDLYEAAVLGWARAFEIPEIREIGDRSIWVYWTIVTTVLAGSTLFLFILGRGRGAEAAPAGTSAHRSLSAVAIGLVALLAGEAGPWSAGLPVHLNFPSSRLTLPLMLGAALLLASILSAIRPRLPGVILMALIVGFSAGRNFWTAADYRWDWVRQKAFLWQLVWRVPGLEPGTAILTDDLPTAYETDNSLTAIVNWVYPPGVAASTMPFIVYDIQNRLGSRFPDLAPGHSIRHVYWTFANGRSLIFEGSTSQVLVIYHAYPACLRVVQPAYDGYMRGLPSYVHMAFDLSRPDLVQLDPIAPARVPTEILGEEPERGWCFYYEKADLARQEGDWDQAFALAKQALALGQSPSDASEYILFLEALGRHGEVAEAKRLSELVLARAPGLDGMLCDAWERIAQAHPPDGQEGLIREVEPLLPCLSAAGPGAP